MFELIKSNEKLIKKILKENYCFVNINYKFLK